LKKLKQLLFIVLWSGLAIGLMVSMGFVNQKQDTILYKNLEVNVNQDGDLCFLDKKDIVQLLYDRGDSIVGSQKIKVSIPEIERVLNSHEDIANAEVSATIDGCMKIKIKQRKPIIRIFNTVGESYYIDNEGKLMPLSEKYTANVLVANGKIYESYALHYKYPVNEFKKETINAQNMLGKLYAMATYIYANKFWRAQVQQLYVNKEQEIELVPMVGDQKIIFGDTMNLDEKFKKLYIFYQQGLNTTGWWNKYSTINLKFKNQIVCTKKI